MSHSCAISSGEMLNISLKPFKRFAYFVFNDVSIFSVNL